jgi:hypothetical protein
MGWEGDYILRDIVEANKTYIGRKEKNKQGKSRKF